jgi:acyl-CoA thioesterase
VVGETSGALRVDHEGGPPTVWFPRADVSDPSVGWSRGAEALDGFLSPDPDQLAVEVVDGGGVAKRFPTWGDVADLLAVLDVQPDGADRYAGAVRADWRRPVVEGSQLLAQGIVAAGRRRPDDRVVAASMVFTRVADAGLPVAIELEEVTSGRTFGAVEVRAVQAGRVCATGHVLLGRPSDHLLRHQVGAPDVVGPDGAVPHDMSVTGRDLRIVDGAYTGDPDAPLGPPVLDAWMRYRDVPDDPWLHVALLAQFTGHLSIAAALRPHAGIGQDQAHVSISTAINAIHLSVHDVVRADQWLLFHHNATHAGGGMIHADCRVHDEDGLHVASFSVEAMARAFADPAQAGDPARAL